MSERFDSLVLPRELTHINKRVQELYRPRKWRGILSVESAPTWAEFVEDQKERSFIEEPTNITLKGPTDELPEPSFELSTGQFRMYSFGYSYSYTDDEQERAAKLGINLVDKKISAVNLGAETFLENVAAIGHTKTGMKGLGTIADVSTPAAGSKTGGGTTWTGGATQLEIVSDLHAICDSVQTNSKESRIADTIALPLIQYQKANTKMTGSPLERTALELFRSQRPEVRNIFVWDLALKNTGSGVTPCMMAWDSSDTDGKPVMVVATELQFGTPLRKMLGWVTPAKLRIGGVVCRNPTSVSKMSGL